MNPTLTASATLARLQHQSASNDADGHAARGFEIGWDLAHYRLDLMAGSVPAGSPVRSGWEAGRAAFGLRSLRATAPVQKWLQLRLNAWRRGKAFAQDQVTPGLLARIAVTHCPITGEALTHGTGGGSDASVDRVNNAAGYAAGNLAMMSAHANAAKGDCDLAQAASFARQVERGRLGQIDGLDARQWARVAALISYCTPLAHDEAARLPLLVLPPTGLRLLNPAQGLQAVLTQAFAQPGLPPRIDTLVQRFPRSLQADLRNVLGMLQARRTALGPAPTREALRAAMEAAWGEVLLNRRWQRVALRLHPAHCDAILRTLPAALPGASFFRMLDGARATEGWALERGGLDPLPLEVPARARVDQPLPGVAVG